MSHFYTPKLLTIGDPVKFPLFELDSKAALARLLLVTKAQTTTNVEQKNIQD